MAEIDEAKPRRGRGRPPGTADEPGRLLLQELVAHLKTYRQAREEVQRRIDTERSTLTLDEIATIMDMLRKGIGEMARGIVAPARPESAKGKAEDEESAEAILARLTGGGE